ncbi:MAG TPA: RNA polymerase sigma factor [Candidatus Binatus sp.]|nr:RNA polymerase sigma factor [Candidatus Binatus sp.]
MKEPELPDQIREAARAAWYRYVDFLAPFRPQLYRYCRRLTGNIWDAEDLAQDTVVRGFSVLSRTDSAIDNPRGYLIRIATNLWVDATRRRASEMQAVEHERNQTGAIDAAPEKSEVRDAASRTMQMLAPQERAALVLKEVFDLSLDEIAKNLGTSVGAVKAALHRGRSTLEDNEQGRSPRRPTPSTALVDRFVERLNASDLPGLLALMLDTASIDMPGKGIEVGREEFERKGSWLWQAVHVHPELPAAVRPPKFVNERVTFNGEPMMLGFMVHGDSKLLMAVARFEEDAGRIAKIRSYNFSPEVLQELAAELGLAAGFVPYRFPAAT